MAEVTGFRGRIDWDGSKPDGTMTKRMDVGRMAALGWRASTPFAEGLAATYAWFRENAARGL